MTTEKSKAVYDKLQASKLLSKHQKHVVHHLYAHKDSMTGHEINYSMGSHSGHKRLSELRRLGVIIEAERRKCRCSGVVSRTWQLTHQMPVVPEPEEKPAVTIQIYPSGRAVLNGQEYEHVSMNQRQGVKKGSRGVWPNGRVSAQVNLWSGMEVFPDEAQDLNTKW